MVPRFGDNLKSLAPEEAGLADIVSTIRNIGGGSDSCGYVDSDTLHYHLIDAKRSCLGGSRGFTFISLLQPKVRPRPITVSVLSFLQDPMEKALFGICKELDALWHGTEMLRSIQDQVSGGTHATQLLPQLMKKGEHQKHGDCSEMRGFWGTIWHCVMAERLRVRVRIVES